ncbi:MAG TPA: hypothetical protein VJ302_11695 [Blastocatellia bacterium]|nr:hypothetical protein [Blastocatellia bacterium]
MFQSIKSVNHRQSEFTNPVATEVPVKLRMPAGYRGQTVPASIVVLELLWQQYGLDLLHPEVSRWLERNAPDVKGAIAGNRVLSGDRFEVGSRATIELRLTLKADDRLREVSSQYLLSQVQPSMELEQELRPAA